MTFQKNHPVLQDVAKAGRKSAKNSPWRKGFSVNSHVAYARLKKPIRKEK
jgi:hypothetical protein